MMMVILSRMIDAIIKKKRSSNGNDDNGHATRHEHSDHSDHTDNNWII